MKRFYLFILSFFLSLPLWAAVDLAPLLNKVTLQLQTELWIKTQTALVTVGINAAVADQDIGSIQMNVMNKLKQLSDKSEWHIVSFNRQLDQSGLEKVQISAQARLTQTDLSDLRNKAKTLSKPGETFTLDDVTFTPSDDEIRQANAALRYNLYEQAKNEMDILNKIYPDQKYYLYSIDFTIMPPAPMPETMMYSKAANRSSPAPVSVGSKMQLQATVVFASIPDILTQKLKEQ